MTQRLNKRLARLQIPPQPQHRPHRSLCSLDRRQIERNASAEVDRFGDDGLGGGFNDVVEVVVGEMYVVEAELGDVLESELEGLVD